MYMSIESSIKLLLGIRYMDITNCRCNEVNPMVPRTCLYSGFTLEGLNKSFFHRFYQFVEFNEYVINIRYKYKVNSKWNMYLVIFLCRKNQTHLQCITTECTDIRDGEHSEMMTCNECYRITVEIDNNIITSTNDTFCYREDPQITSVSRNATIIR